MQKPNIRRKLFREFEAAFDKKLYAFSVELGREYLRQYPKDGKAWLMYAKMLRQQARYPEARLALQRVIKSSPEWLWLALVEMGRLYRAQGNLKKAAVWFRKAIEAEPEKTPSRIFLGGALLWQGRLKEAEECYRRATECPEGDIDEAFCNLGFMLRAQEKYEEAQQCFLKALELDPRYKEVKYALKDMEQVLADGQRWMSAPPILVPGAPPPPPPKQKQKVQKKLFREFKAAYEKSLYAYHLELGKEYLRHYPNDLSAWLLYGITLRQMARYHEARLALQYVIKRISKESVRAWLLAEIGHLYESKGELKKAAEWYQKSIVARPADADAHIFLGSVLTQQGRLKEAEACHRRATECTEGDVDKAFVTLGFVLRAQGKYEEARQCYLKALELEPRFKAVKRLVKDLEKVLELQKRDIKA